MLIVEGHKFTWPLTAAGRAHRNHFELDMDNNNIVFFAGPCRQMHFLVVHLLAVSPIKTNTNLTQMPQTIKNNKN